MTGCLACCHEAQSATEASSAELVPSVVKFQSIGLNLEGSSIGSGPPHKEALPEQPDPEPSQDARLKGRAPSAASSLGNEVPSPDKRISAVPTFHGQDILRVTSIKSLLRRRGSILQNNSGSADTYLLSKPGQSIDIFVSHNWAVSRRKKFWALALYVNVVPAVVVSYICAAVGIVMNLSGVPPVFKIDGMTMRPYCVILGSIGFWLVMLFGHDIPFSERLWWNQQVFLDKICIHQTDPALKAMGINSLGAFLRYSKKMLVLFNAVYCKRLWTVYEMACYMYLHRRDQLELLPVDIASVVLKTTSLITAVHWVSLVFIHVASTQSMDGIAPGFVSLVIGSVLVGTLACIMRSWARRQSSLFSDLRSFRISHADCADENDRVVVSSNICAFVRSMGLVENGASDEEALLSFDKLVQERMPELLRNAIGHAGLPYKYALVAGIGYDFYALDEMSSDENPTTLGTFARLVHLLVTRTSLFPAIFLVCALMGLGCKPREKRAELGVKASITLTALTVTYVLFQGATWCKDLAMTSVWWLFAYLAIGIGLLLVIVKLYSSRPPAKPMAALESISEAL